LSIFEMSRFIYSCLIYYFNKKGCHLSLIDMTIYDNRNMYLPPMHFNLGIAQL
jgi:hypothetical protein